MGISNLVPYKKYTVAKVSDGEGGFSYTVTAETVIYMNMIVHEDKRVATVRTETDVSPDDYILVDDALYRVEPTIMYIQEGLFKSLELVRVERPIFPLPSSSS